MAAAGHVSGARADDGRSRSEARTRGTRVDMNAADTNSADSLTSTPRRRSRWTDVLLTVCGVFVLTVLLMLASALNPNAGLLAQLFDRHGVKILAVEVGAILVVAIIVLFVERKET